MKKGFSLFTPLVGTAIVIIAIVASVTMMQSDARISRGLAKSYEISSQEIVAKLIKATAEMQILTNLKSETLNDLSTGYTIICSGSVSSCVYAVETAMSNNLPSIRAELFRGLSDAFENIICSGCSIEMDEAGMSSKIRDLSNALMISFENGYLKETINSNALSGFEDIFSITFIDVRGNSIQVLIAPHDFSYTTDDKIGDLIQATANSFIEMKNVLPLTLNYEGVVENKINDAIGFNPCGGIKKLEKIDTSVYYQGQGLQVDNAALEVEWRVENGNKFNLEICGPDACKPVGYLKKQLSCSCLFGNLKCQVI